MDGSISEDDDRVLLTLDQLQEWERRLSDLEGELRPLRAEHATLCKKINAARVILGA